MSLIQILRTISIFYQQQCRGSRQQHNVPSYHMFSIVSPQFDSPMLFTHQSSPKSYIYYDRKG